jgi:uncharacterized protein (TIGR03083 family)
MSDTEALDAMALATAERRDLADLLETLTDDEWVASSLCDGWSVRDVVAHVVSYEELSTVGLVLRMGRAVGRAGQANAIGLRELADATPADLLTQLRAHLRPTGLTAGFGGRIGLTDALIHHQDIRRPLDRPRTVPGERVLVALDMAMRAPTLPSRKKVKGLRLVATDVDWTTGDGPEIAGSGEALLMAIAGRYAALDDLEGNGLDRLRAAVG